MRITSIVNVNGRRVRGPRVHLTDDQVREIFQYRKMHTPAETAEYFNLRLGRLYNLNPRFKALGLDVAKLHSAPPKGQFQPKTKAAPPAEASKAILEQIKQLQSNPANPLFSIIEELQLRATALRTKANAIDKIIAEIPALMAA